MSQSEPIPVLRVTPLREPLKERLRRAAGHRFPTGKQRRLDMLLSQSSEKNLTAVEREELRQLTREYEQGMIAKAEALNALKELGEDITPYLKVPTDA